MKKKKSTNAHGLRGADAGRCGHQPEPKDVATLLGHLAAKHRRLANDHQALADEFKAVAIAVMEREEEAAAQLAKFNQIRELLKGGL